MKDEDERESVHTHIEWKKLHWIQYEKDGVIYIQPYAVEGEIPEEDHR